MHIYRFLEKKITIQKVHFPKLFKKSSSIHNNPALVASIVLKKIYFHGICALSKKKTVTFTRSCAFAQKAKFYALKMLKKQNLTHPKAAKLATPLHSSFMYRLYLTSSAVVIY